VVTTIDAVNDPTTTVNGSLSGVTTIPSVFINDTINGVSFVSTDVILTYLPLPTGFTFNSDGTISVAPGTTPGTYPITYTICQVANPIICDTATLTVIVATIDAVNDPTVNINGTTGGTTPSIFTNDTLNGLPVVATDVILTSLPLPAGLILNSDGTITVPPGTTPGTYTITYTICQVAYPTICDTATITVIVDPCLSSPILDCDGDGVTNGQEVIDGTDPSNPCSFILASATVTPSTAWNAADCDGDGVTNGQEIVDGTNPLNPCSFVLASATVTTSTAWNAADCDGDGVTNGQEIVDGTNPLNPCSFVLASATVTPSTAWNAADCDGDGVTNGQEIVDGTNPLNPCSFILASATVTPSTAWNAADCDGDGVTNGQEIIDGTNPLDPCSFVLASATVAPSSTWNAADCDGDGVTNGQEITDGTNPLDPCSFVLASATVTPSTAWNAADCDGDGVTNGQEITDGTNPLDSCSFVLASATVTPSTAWNAADCDGDGVTNGQEIVDGTNPLNPCSFVLASATVTPSTAWNAADCDGDGVTNGQEITDGTNPLDPCSLVLSSQTLTPSNAWLALDCDNDGNPNSTDPNPLVPTAVNDTFTSPIGVATSFNIIANDDFIPGANLSITAIGGTALGTVSFDPLTGLITYTPLPSEGGSSVTVVYQVCNTLTNVCATATVTIIVPIFIVANDDDLTAIPVDGFEGGIAGNIFENNGNGIDTLNGNPIIGNQVIITVITGGTLTGATISSNGDVNVPAGTPAGTYTVFYQICAVSNPAVCDTAIITIVVNAPTILATDDDYSGTPVNSETGDTFSIFTNDTINGNPISPSDVIFTIIDNGGIAGATIDGQGNFNVPAGTPVGNYIVTYTICDVINPNNCSTATIIIVVKDPCDFDDSPSSCDIIVYNTISANGDGINEAFVLEGIERYPNNSVCIFNRWGVLVYDAKGYNNSTVVFKGISEGRSTIKQADGLPEGTYFYVLKYTKSNGNVKEKAGYLYINRE
jgi:large repetitive protein